MPEAAKVFIKRENKVEPGFNVGVVLNKKATKGTIGIEIEVEGSKLPHEDSTPPPWVYHHDGSLRGNDNGEYVLAHPVEFKDVPGALETLWDTFKAKKSTLDDSNRTSVHLHLNCQQFHFNRLTSFAALYFAFEEVLTAWCGDHRVGNLFCMRAKDAPAIISQLKRFIRSDGRTELSSNLHYAGFNCHALHKFGSVEIRALRGCPNPQTILDWVGIIERLYTLSAEFQDPRDICSMFSGEGPLAFFDNVLGSMGPIVRSGIDYDNDKIVDAMYEGIRLAQDLCYCRDWGVFKPVNLSADPFGRDPRKVMKSVGHAASGLDMAAALASIDDTLAPVAPSAPSQSALSQAAQQPAHTLSGGMHFDDPDFDPFYD